MCIFLVQELQIMATPEEIDDYGRASPLGNDPFFYTANAVTPIHKSPTFGGWTQTDATLRQSKVPSSDRYMTTGAPYAVVVAVAFGLGALLVLFANS
jgi:hypothetical protein